MLGHCGSQDGTVWICYPLGETLNGENLFGGLISALLAWSGGSFLVNEKAPESSSHTHLCHLLRSQVL